MLRLYNLLLYLFLPVILVRLIIRGFRNPAYWHRWRERFGFIPHVAAVDIWIHAVSVGEVRAAAPLIERLLSEREFNIVLTTMTPTGSDEVGRLFAQQIRHFYAPYDYSGSVKRFLARIKPRLALIMETEIWPNIIGICSANNIPVLFANLRMSNRSFERYLSAKKVMQQTLGQVQGFAVQSESDADRIRRLGADPANVHVTGSIKFEIRTPASLKEVAQVLRREWGQDRMVFVAGSTHEGEDEMILQAYAELKNNHPDLLLVLVPRHPERFSTAYKTARRHGFKVTRRSAPKRNMEDVEVYVGDTMGELTLLYAAADVAFVGGSLVASGGHNLLEPCALGVPVVFGPHMFNFLQISELTLERKAGVQVKTAEELTAALERYLSDPNLRFKTGEAGKQLVEENKGALEKTLALVMPHL